MKEKLKKISDVMKLIFGYSIMSVLFIGGLTALGYTVALIVGGDTAASICDFIYNRIFKFLIYASSVTVLFGLLAMYVGGEYALTSGKNEKKK